MSSQQSSDRSSNRPLSHITLHARQMLRANTQRAANWFRKASFPRIKLKPGFISSRRSQSSPYSHSSSTDESSRSIQSSSTTLHVPETTTTYSSQPYNTRLVRTSPVVIPIMPTVRLVLVHWCPRWRELVLTIIMHHVLSLVLDLVPIPFKLRQLRSWVLHAHLY